MTCPHCNKVDLEVSHHWIDCEPFMACPCCNSTYVMEDEAKINNENERWKKSQDKNL